MFSSYYSSLPPGPRLNNNAAMYKQKWIDYFCFYFASGFYNLDLEYLHWIVILSSYLMKFTWLQKQARFQASQEPINWRTADDPSLSATVSVSTCRGAQVWPRLALPGHLCHLVHLRITQPQHVAQQPFILQRNFDLHTIHSVPKCGSETLK